ncbi:MAG: RNA-binding domain-containing protein [Nanoarchaeota archaeon]
MPFAHTVTVQVFASGDEEQTQQGLLSLFPFSLAEEKIPLQRQKAEGFEERFITILRVQLTKAKHTDAFLRGLMAKLSNDTKATLLQQLDSRLDSQLQFFIRLDKDRLLSGEYALTEQGNCFHLRIVVAAFPHRRETAKAVVEKLLSL